MITIISDVLTSLSHYKKEEVGTGVLEFCPECAQPFSHWLFHQQPQKRVLTTSVAWRKERNIYSRSRLCILYDRESQYGVRTSHTYVYPYMFIRRPDQKVLIPYCLRSEMPRTWSDYHAENLNTENLSQSFGRLFVYLSQASNLK